MNFIFVSPHFPKTYWNFCDRLHRNGVNVLGIGDAPFDEIPWELKQCLTEYYRVNDLGNYDEMLRAVAYFTFHYGKIDWIESNNEYWLEMDAQLRTDFNINTGAKNDFIERIKYKSKMKESYIAAGVPVARYHIVSTLAEARAFIKEVGYPVIVKPDNGCGAEATYKLRNFTELKEFYAEPHNLQRIPHPAAGHRQSERRPLLLDAEVRARCAEGCGLPHHQGVRRKEPLLPLRVFPVE